MKLPTPLYALALALFTLVACTGKQPTVSPSEPHGIVSSVPAQTADRVYRVVVTRVDGVNIGDFQRTSHWLPPGNHTLRVVALVAPDNGLILGGPRRSKEDWREFDIQVEEGRHYTIGGKVTGPRFTDWEPVVVSVRGG